MYAVKWKYMRRKTERQRVRKHTEKAQEVKNGSGNKSWREEQWALLVITQNNY